MADLYDADVLEWSEHQGSLLRRIAAGEVPNEAPDWKNIVEEVEEVGRSQLNAVRSLLVQALTHELKCSAWPEASYVSHWRAEARALRRAAARSFTPSMRQRIDLAELYADAVEGLPEEIDGVAPALVPGECQASLDALLSRDGRGRRRDG